MSSKDIRWIRSYLLAILTVFLALQAIWFIQPYLSTEPPFITFLAAIMVTAWYGGLRPALFATLLSAGLIDYYLLDPVQSFNTAPADVGSLAFFGMVATTMAYAVAHLQQDRQQLEHLHALSQQLLKDEKLERKLQRVLTAVLDLLGAHKGVIRLYDPENNTLALTTQVGFNQEEHSPQFQQVSVDASSCGTVIQCNERVMIENIATDARCSHLVALPAMSDVVSAHSMPLFRADRGIFGVLTTYHTRRSFPSEGAFRLVDLYARQAERVLEAKSQEEGLRGLNADLIATLDGLISELAGTEERERQQLASELHDSLAQFLALSQMKLRLAQRFLSHSPGTSARYIQETAEAITRSLEYARTLIAELCPP
jgi:nitrate/nitrite-specific signal transduction histidine kinase